MKEIWEKLRIKFNFKWALWTLIVFYIIYSDQTQPVPASSPISLFLFLLVFPWFLNRFLHRGGRRSKVKIRGKNFKLFKRAVRFKTSFLGGNSIVVRFRGQNMLVGENVIPLKEIKSISMNFERSNIGKVERLVSIIVGIPALFIIFNAASNFVINREKVIQMMTNKTDKTFEGIFNYLITYIFDSMGNGKWFLFLAVIFNFVFPLLVRLTFSQVFKFTTIQDIESEIRMKFPMSLIMIKENEFKKFLKKLNKNLPVGEV